MAPIDMHAHVFNLRYLPVAGIIRRYSKNKVGVKIARGLQWFFWRYTASSFDIDGEEPEVSPTPMVPIEIFNNDMLSKMSDDELLANLSAIPRSKDFSGTPLGEALDEFEEISPSAMLPILEFSRRKPFEPLSAEDYAFAKNGLRRLLNWLAGQLHNGIDHIRWFALMMNSEEFLFRQLLKDNDGVNNYVHHTMDVDGFFDDEETGEAWHSHYPFYPTQVKRMEQLRQNHAKQLRGFVAFNPTRHNALTVVKDSLAIGFTGVKFYPPMGYKPFGDENPVIAARIEELIAYCVQHDVPLFTHCNNSGFEAFPARHSGYCSNPVYWEQVLIKKPTLRLCLGHGGGGEGWFTTNYKEDHVLADDILAGDIRDATAEQQYWNHSYAAMVFKLCVQYKNVYCDFSYLDDMIHRDGSLDPVRRESFRLRLIRLIGSEPSFANKMMYGSDWHMLYREKKHGVFYQAYKEFFSDPAFDGCRELFFEGNAKNYCG